jgi:hypothetical protein
MLSSHVEREHFNTADLQYVFLPPICEVEASDERAVLRYAKTALIKKNFNMMVHMDFSVLNEKEGKEWTNLMYFIHNQYSQFGFTLDHLKASKHVHDTLRDELRESHFAVFRQIPRIMENVEQRVTEIFEGVKGNFLFFSGTHASLYAEVKAAKKVNNAQNIGLVLLDRHTDIFDSATGRAQRSQLSDEYAVGKENVVHMLLQENLVTAVSCIGVSAIERLFITQGYPEDDDLVATHERYLLHKDRLFITDEAIYMHDHMMQTEIYKQQIIEHVEAFKRMGIERVIFSIDADVFKFPYTAVDYSNVGFLLNLAIQDFSIIEKQAKSAVSKKDIPRYIYEQMLRAAQAPYYPIRSVKHMCKSTVKAVNGYGLRLADVDSAIRAFGSVFPVGVPLPLGGVFAGDMTELVGYDLGGHTAKTAKILANTIRSMLAT